MGPVVSNTRSSPASLTQLSTLGGAEQTPDVISRLLYWGSVFMFDPQVVQSQAENDESEQRELDESDRGVDADWIDVWL